MPVQFLHGQVAPHGHIAQEREVGVVGKFFFQFGVTISVAVAFSLIEALTIAPMRCSQFLDVGHTTKFGKAVDRQLTRVTNGYRALLRYFLNHRAIVLLVSAAIFFGSLGLTSFLK